MYVIIHPGAHSLYGLMLKDCRVISLMDPSVKVIHLGTKSPWKLTLTSGDWNESTFLIFWQSRWLWVRLCRASITTERKLQEVSHHLSTFERNPKYFKMVTVVTFHHLQSIKPFVESLMERMEEEGVGQCGQYSPWLWLDRIILFMLCCV